ncbi:hypothetical protein MMC14_007397 [Varicellaria rhodocarpa]|nr:hypothetical protein [Varicellaria rhodocarpa]
MAVTQNAVMHHFSTSSRDDEPPTPPPKDTPNLAAMSPAKLQSYFSPRGSSRPTSMYSLSRASFANQLSQLTFIQLPDAGSLSSNISSKPTAASAAKALSNHASQIQKWIHKALEVLSGLDAEDDVEWAAAGGREGLGEVDMAIGKFEGLIGVYVTAIEQLEERRDISSVPADDLRSVVDQMEKTLADWENVRRLLKGVKEQVELAMEWEELWGTVLGDIGLEVESLGRHVFEMEEKRHKALSNDTITESSAALDIQELETIVEDSPAGAASITKTPTNRFSLPPAFPASSPIQSPNVSAPQEDSNLLALFARMQPLRASLDFLPMRLCNFQSRAETILPTACQELETRRSDLEQKWKKLQTDAEGLRRELSEDRWVLVFRNAGRQAQKMCESVERSLGKLQESIDHGSQHSNPTAFVKKVENYEAKKTYYGPAIQRVLAIIEKGVKDRLTVHGEILRLQMDTQAAWSALEAELKDMDFTLEEINMYKSQQLRDSISTIISNDRSITGSGVDTPGSSPASSVVMGPSSVTRKRPDPSTPGLNGLSRRSSIMPTTSSRPSTAKRNFSMPPNSGFSSRFPHNAPTPRSVTTSSTSTTRESSPYRHIPPSSATPTPVNRSQRPGPQVSDNKPRWNSSPKVDFHNANYKSQPLSLHSPSPYKQNIYAYRSSRSFSAHASNVSLPSPLGREFSASPAPSMQTHSRSRQVSVPQNTTVRARRHTSSSPARSNNDTSDLPHSRIRAPTPSSKLPSFASRRQSMAPRGAISQSLSQEKTPELPDMPESFPSPTQSVSDNVEAPRSHMYAPTQTSRLPSFAARRQSMLPNDPTPASLPRLPRPDLSSGSITAEQSPLPRPRVSRPSTAMANGRRSSMLPQPATRSVSGRDSAAGSRPGGAGRDSVMGSRAGARDSMVFGGGEELRWR